MKKIENVTIYKCDFCKKELKRKHAMVKHEIRCTKNPINNRPCLNGCVHLDKKEIEYETGFENYNTGESETRKGEAFYCSLKKIFMLHPKLQYKENIDSLKYVYHEDEEVKQEWMPKQCDDYSPFF